MIFHFFLFINNYLYIYLVLFPATYNKFLSNYKSQYSASNLRYLYESKKVGQRHLIFFDISLICCIDLNFISLVIIITLL